MIDWTATEGTPFPLGATWVEKNSAWNFAVYSKDAESVTLLLYADEADGQGFESGNRLAAAGSPTQAATRNLPGGRSKVPALGRGRASKRLERPPESQ